jgi:hypothetical protein
VARLPHAAPGPSRPCLSRGHDELDRVAGRILDHGLGTAALHHRYSDQRRTRLIDALTRAQQAGYAVGDPDRAAEALAGAVFYRRLMTPTPPRTEEVDGLVATVLGER